MTYEGLRLKLLSYQRRAFAKARNRELRNKNFTIISNNCWGGMVYESYDLPKQSPTVGLFFMADDYVKFCSDLKGYLSGELRFIRPEESRYADALRGDRRFGSYPIGMIDDIEIMFLHYHSNEEALEKWKRRRERIHWNRLIVKFNDQNGCEERHVKAFAALPFDCRLFFTIKRWPMENSGWGGGTRLRYQTIYER